MQYFFRCKENTKAPIVVVNERWEAEEFAKHPDYERVNAEGRLLQSADDAFDNVRPAKHDPLDVTPPLGPQLTENPEDLY